MSTLLKELEEAKRLGAEAAASSTIGQAVKRVGWVADTWKRVVSSLTYIWAKWLSPWLGPIGWVFIWTVIYPCAWLWRKIAWFRGNFSPLKGAVALVSQAAYLFVAWQSIFLAFHLILFAFTHTSESIYLSNAQELGVFDNVFSVQGCEAVQGSGGEISCSGDNTLYFRSDGTLFTHLWSLVNKGGLYYPEYVTGPVAPGWQKCYTYSYGLRVKMFMRSWDIYPIILDTTCRSI